MRSTVPAALDALLTRFAAALEPDSVNVIDGPLVSSAGLREALIVGYAGDGGTAVEQHQERASASTAPAREQYQVNCMLQVLRDDQPSARDRAYDLLELVAGVLAADKSLGGVVMSAQLAGHSLTPSATKQGQLASMRFAVEVDAFTS